MNPLFYKLKTLWLLIKGKVALHKTLLKRLFFCVILILILLIIAGFLYYNFYFKKDTLIKYVPKEAVFYSTLRINGEIKENILLQNIYNNINKEYNLPELDSAILNPYIGYNFALAMIPQENDFYNYNYLILLNLGTRPDDRILEDRGLYWHYFNNEYFNTNIMAISDSARVIEKVIGARNQEWPSLASRIGVTVSLNKLKISKLGKIFIDVEALGEHFSKLTDLKLKTLFAAIKDTKIDQIYLNADFKDNKIILSNSNYHEQPKLLLSQIPPDYLLNVKTNNATQQISQIINIISQLDPNYYQQILKNIEYSQGLYDLDWQKDVLPLFMGEIQFVFYPDKEFILAINTNSITDIAQKIKKFEDVVSSVYLINEPKYIEKKMPDGTYITQIFKGSNKAFEDKIVNNNNLKVFMYENMEFGYYLTENLLILANSFDILEKIAENERVIELKTENLANYKTNFIIKPIWPILDNINYAYYSEENSDILLILE